MSCIAHKLNGKPIPLTLHHSKRLAKHQIPHDIEDHPVTPIRHIPFSTPAITLFQHPPAIHINNHISFFFINLLRQPSDRPPHTAQNPPL